MSFFIRFTVLACLEQTHVSRSVHHCSLKILFFHFSFASHLLSKRDIRLDQFEICLCKYRLFLAYWFICLRPHVYGLWKIFWCAIFNLFMIDLWMHEVAENFLESSKKTFFCSKKLTFLLPGWWKWLQRTATPKIVIVLNRD